MSAITVSIQHFAEVITYVIRQESELEDVNKRKKTLPLFTVDIMVWNENLKESKDNTTNQQLKNEKFLNSH